MKAKWYPFLIMLVAGCGAFAQKFTASASKTKVAVGEQFQISYNLNTGGSSYRGPDLKEFNVYSGPNPSSTTLNINGNRSQTQSYFYIISARKEGKFTISPASINSGGNRIESNTLTIEVVKGSSTPGNQQQQQRPSDPSQSTSDNLFVKTWVNKNKAYIGEQITISHKIYTRLSIRGFQDIKYPPYNGFWSQDLVSQIKFTAENIDGITYHVAEVKKSFLFPQRTGTLEITPIEIDCIVRELSSSAPQSIIEQIFGSIGYRDVVYKIKSRPVKIEVMPLPAASKPDDFNGAVGDFSFKIQNDKKEIKANEAINISVRISGKGNLKLIDPLKIKFPEEFETYDPKTIENISVNADGITGSKTFEYLVIPRQEGLFTINNIQFSYFDPEKKNYITLPSPELIIEVNKPDAGTGQQSVISSVNKEDVKMLGNDIRYIKTGEINLISQNTYFFGSPGFIAGLSIPLLVLGSFLLVRRRNIIRNRDLVVVKSRRANKAAQKRLSQAYKQLQQNNKEFFYEEVLKALNEYLSNKFNIPVSELSRESIASILEKSGIDKELISQAIDTLITCETARYAPSLASSNLNHMYEQASKVITKLENKVG